jgi:hypothetical protein
MIYDIKPLNDRTSETPTNFVSVYGNVNAFGGGGGVKTEYTERRSTQGETEPVSTCAFGSIIRVGSGRAVAGGAVTCGETNENLDPYTFSTSSTIDTLLWIEVDYLANRDDDEEIFLPGMTSASSIQWRSGSSYPDNDPPTVTSGTGTLIVPIGNLVVESGVATLLSSSCGNISINQCAGSPSYVRA